MQQYLYYVRTQTCVEHISHQGEHTASVHVKLLLYGYVAFQHVFIRRRSMVQDSIPIIIAGLFVGRRGIRQPFAHSQKQITTSEPRQDYFTGRPTSQ